MIVGAVHKARPRDEVRDNLQSTCFDTVLLSLILHTSSGSSWVAAQQDLRKKMEKCSSSKTALMFHYMLANLDLSLNLLRRFRKISKNDS
jgi:hypothetical protein